MPNVQHNTRKSYFVIGDIHGKMGYHLGDEAMFLSAVDYMNEILPAHSPIVLAWDPNEVRSLYDCKTVLRYAASNRCKWLVTYVYFLVNALFYKTVHCWIKLPGFPSLEAIQAINESSFVLHTGSGTWNTAGKSGWWLFDILVYLWSSFCLNVPVLIVSQSLGPFSGKSLDKRIVSWLAKRTLRMPNIRLVTVRDRIWSAEFLKLTCRPDQILGSAFDDAVWLSPAADKQTDEFLTSYDIKPASKFIIVSLSEAVSGSALHAFGMAFSRFLALHAEYRFVFIPHVWPKSDLKIHRNIAMLIKNKEQITLVNSFCDAKLLKSLTARAAAVISSRYHGMVIAASAGIPGTAIISNEEYRRKMTGLINMVKSTNISALDVNCSVDEISYCLGKEYSTPQNR